MQTHRQNSISDTEEPQLKVQALVVTAGPFAGRICENDDDEFIFRSNLTRSEAKWFEAAGVRWRHLRLDENDSNDDGQPDLGPGVDCEVVTFGFYLQCRGHYFIPRQFLRPATTRDLIVRHQDIQELVFQDAWLEKKSLRRTEIVELLKEENYIVNELWRREKVPQDVTEPRDIFLCHSSADKPFVRQLYSDLANVGHRPWIDEFEIKVGDSIVQKITEGTQKASALVLFLSNASIHSPWVTREWSSTLAAQLASKNIKILPALIEDCQVPGLLSDLKYADFRDSYNDGLEELLIALK